MQITGESETRCRELDPRNGRARNDVGHRFHLGVIIFR